jgi:molybdate transport system substrate-binding protein
MRLTTILRLIGAAVALSFLGHAASAAEIKLIASRAVQEAYGELLPQFEKATGNKVTVSWGGTGDITKRIQDGEVADIVIVTDFAIDALIKEGKLTNTGSAIVAKSPAGAAMKTGGTKPDLSSADGLKKSLLAAKGIVITPGPSNSILHQRFETLGIASQMNAKEVKPAAGQQLTDPVAEGKADFVFSQASELMTIKGISYVGPLPKGLEITLVYKAAYHIKAPQLDAAKALVKFLTAPGVVKVLEAKGLEPG